MTSINAIRFDEFSGAMVCDEQRHWNDERLKIYAADKIKTVVPGYIRDRYGVAACYGNTGTSAIGDELRMTISREIESIFKKQVQELGHEPETFMNVGDIARLTFQVISRMKHTHVDDHLKHKYGFSTADYIHGRYTRDGREYAIENDVIVREAGENVARDPGRMGSDAVFGNGGIIAGYDAIHGFQIYQFSMKEGVVEPIESGYVALGSGGDTTNFVLPGFFNTTGVIGRNAGIDPIDGLCAVMDAVNMASDHNLGVGGYFNIILFDRKADNADLRYREINDHRSRLISEIVRAKRTGFITPNECHRIVKGLLFEGQDADWAEKNLWDAVGDLRGLHRVLRGYPVPSR